MKSHFHRAVVSALAILCACCNAPRGKDAAEDQRPDVTVSFHVRGQHGALDRPTRVWLNASKPGRRSVGSVQSESSTGDGMHQYPTGTTAHAIAAYYGPILIRAGWENADFCIVGNAIHFYKPTRIAARSDAGQLVVSVTPH